MRADEPLPAAPDNRILLALGFTFAHESADVAIVGTKTPEYMHANLELVEHDLPLAEATVRALHRRFEEAGQDWSQLS